MPVASTSSAPSLNLGPLRAVFGVLSEAHAAWIVLLASVVLSAIGIYAISVSDLVDIGPVAARIPAATKQTVFLAIGIGSAIIIALPHYRIVGYLAIPALFVLVGLLIFLLIPFVPRWLVTPRNGARSWIDIGPIDFQPSELAKIAFVLVLARYLRFRSNYRRFLGLVPPGLIAAIPIGLITLQPDLGTATLFVPVLFAMLVAAGAKLRHLIIIVVLATAAAPAAYPLLKPHQKQRIQGLIQQFKGDTSADQDINMQSVSAQRIIGSGGFVGQSTASVVNVMRYNHLPERHNDMIFAVIAGRFGLLGTVGLLATYLTWVIGAMLCAAATRDPFARLIIIGLTGFVAAQTFVNIGMNIGLLPIIGITLPFVSYGGSSLVTVWLMTGLIFSVSIRRPRPPIRQSFEYGEDDE